MIIVFDLITLFCCLWLMVGALVTLCAMNFLKVKPSGVRRIVAMVAGPFAIQREWWLS